MSKREINCPICLDPIEKRRKVMLKCGHIMHPSCYDLMISYPDLKKSCPLCRKPLQKKRPFCFCFYF